MARKNPLIHLDGADELNAALREIGLRAGGLILKHAAEAGAQVIADEAELFAPKDTGALSIGIELKPGRIQQGRAVFDVRIGKGEWYGKLIELGTEKMAAQPFMRPAFDAKSEEAIQAVQDVLAEALRDVLDG
jgi:HK97 gp10 family phage protein